MRIIELKAENIKKLKAVTIRPDSDTVLITGRNGQGKTSVLDSIFFALAGKDAQKETPKPIRDGQDHAEISIDLGDRTVKRTFTPHGSSVSITSKDGLLFPRPQELLDGLVGMLSFDPLEFSRMKPAEQRSALLEIVDIGVNLEQWEATHKGLYDQRTALGREVKALAAQLDAIPYAEVEGAPEKEVSVAELAKELSDGQAKNSAAEAAVREVQKFEEGIVRQRTLVEKIKADLAAAEGLLANMETDIVKARADAAQAPRVDLVALQKRLADADRTNALFRRRQERERISAAGKEKVAEHRAVEAKMEDMVKQRTEALAKAKMPIEGLSIDDTGIIFNGQPFTQLSSAEQLKISLSIAMAKKPELRVVRILDGSLLDDDNLKVVAEMAEKHDFQVWIEKVDTSGKVGVVIEDGEVKAVNPA